MPNTELRREWEARVTEFRASGMSATKWSEAKGLKVHQLWYWLAKFKQEPSECAGWLQVKVAETARTNSLLVKVGQATIEVQSGFDPELLADVVTAIGRAR